MVMVEHADNDGPETGAELVDRPAEVVEPIGPDLETSALELLSPPAPI
jgi:hypothetical protein